MLWLFIYWLVGCSEPKQDVLIHLYGIADGKADLDFSGLKGQRKGESWFFPQVSIGEHPLWITLPHCPQQYALLALKGNGRIHRHEIEVLCRSLFHQMTFRWIPAGSFAMGSSAAEEHRGKDEQLHRVRISRPFWISETEVTQGTYRAMMGKNPSLRSASECSREGEVLLENDAQPVYCISWYEAIAFANELSKRDKLQLCYEVKGRQVHWNKGCTGFRLPTEAEWEYAALGISTKLLVAKYAATGKKPPIGYAFAGGDTINEVGWSKENSGNRLQMVKQKKANRWALYDMSGNVAEWVWDMYGGYSAKSLVDPTGSKKASYRIIRGGNWAMPSNKARVAAREPFLPFYRTDGIGLRLVRNVP